jgi:hypothetical protein
MGEQFEQLGNLRPKECFTLAILGGAGDLLMVVRPYGNDSTLVELATGGDPYPLENDTDVIKTINLTKRRGTKGGNPDTDMPKGGLFSR